MFPHHPNWEQHKVSSTHIPFPRLPLPQVPRPRVGVGGPGVGGVGVGGIGVGCDDMIGRGVGNLGAIVGAIVRENVGASVNMVGSGVGGLDVGGVGVGGVVVGGTAVGGVGPGVVTSVGFGVGAGPPMQ